MTHQTGPTTIAGKKRSSQNARKHGIRSAAPIIEDLKEDPAEWERHRIGTIESLEAEGHLEIVLAERIAALLWRLKRIERFETATMQSELEKLPRDLANLNGMWAWALGKKEVEPVTFEQFDVAAGGKLVPPSWAVDRVQKYEAHLHRQLVQTMHELEALQARRRGERVNLARLDISGSPTFKAK